MVTWPVRLVPEPDPLAALALPVPAVAHAVAVDPLVDRHADVDAPSRLQATRDRKSTRLNSSHSQISYAVFCLKKKRLRHIVGGAWNEVQVRRFTLYQGNPDIQARWQTRAAH